MRTSGQSQKLEVTFVYANEPDTPSGGRISSIEAFPSTGLASLLPFGLKLKN
jgi:hypothetical protein